MPTDGEAPHRDKKHRLQPPVAGRAESPPMVRPYKADKSMERLQQQVRSRKCAWGMGNALVEYPHRETSFRCGRDPRVMQNMDTILSAAADLSRSFPVMPLRILRSLLMTLCHLFLVDHVCLVCPMTCCLSTPPIDVDNPDAFIHLDKKTLVALRQRPASATQSCFGWGHFANGAMLFGKARNAVWWTT